MATGDDQRARALAFLSRLTDKQFAEFFYDTVRERDTGNTLEGKGHYVLGDVKRWPAEPRDIDFIALHDKTVYPDGWVDDAPICQSGECPNCASHVRSWAKDAICPVCYAPVRCT